MKKYIIGLFIGLIVLSCSDKLEVTPPSSITDEQVKEILASGDADKIDLIMSGLAETLPLNLISYNSLYSGGFGLSVENSQAGQDILRVLRGNDVVYGKKISGGSLGDVYSLKDFWQTDLETENHGYWYLGATVVTNANKVLGYLDVETVGDNATLKDYRARCLTVRAYGYNYLMESYQDAYLQGGKDKLGVSLYTEYKINTPVARSTSEETYAFIKKDLTEAISLFKEANIGYTEAPDDLDLGVAEFILARVALWTGDWDTVNSMCSSILSEYPSFIPVDNYGFPNEDLDQLTLKNADGDYLKELDADDNAFFCIAENPECLFGFVDGTNAQGYQYSYFNPFSEGSGGISEGFMRIDERLYNKLDDNDVRKGMFMTDELTFTYTDASETPVTIPGYTNLKFAATRARNNSTRVTGNSQSDQPLFRSSEVLLMKAEALAQQNKDSEAKDLLNLLLAARTIDGVTPLTCDTYSSMAGMTTMQMIQFQTRIELWGEGGREFYNNKRWNIPVDRSSSANHINKGSVSVAHMTLEIPSIEIDRNPASVQN